MIDPVSVRLDECTRRIVDVESELRANRPIVLATQIRALEEDVRQLSGEVRGLRRAVIGFAITVAGSAVAFAMTVVLVWGAG